MKILKFGMRLWITLTSVAIFLVSWIIFGHSPKPIDSNSRQAIVAPLPTLEPLPSMSGQQESQPTFQLFPQSNQPRRSPFVTGGS